MCRPFDPALYEDEVEEDNEILDEEGRARLKLKVIHTRNFTATFLLFLCVCVYVCRWRTQFGGDTLRMKVATK